MSPRVIFEQELESLKEKVAQMGQRAGSSYERLYQAVTEEDGETVRQLLDTDRQMTDMQRSIEAHCLTLLTRQQPVACDLRMVSAALKSVTDIERIGDHVTDMSELFLRMEKRGFNTSETGLDEMMRQTGEMLRMAVEAFVNGDAAEAEQVILADDLVDEAFNQIKEALPDAIRRHGEDADRAVDLLMLAKYLEKIGDHAVNISQWTIFQTTGDMDKFRLL